MNFFLDKSNQTQKYLINYRNIVINLFKNQNLLLYCLLEGTRQNIIDYYANLNLFVNLQF